mgnify:CR=1 FL=1
MKILRVCISCILLKKKITRCLKTFMVSEDSLSLGKKAFVQLTQLFSLGSRDFRS